MGSLIVGLFGAPSTADPKGEAPWPVPVSLAVYNHSYQLPFRHLLRGSPWHPGFAVGSEYQLVRWRFGELAQTAEFGWFRSPPVQRALFLCSESLYRYVAPYGPMAELLLGPGYLRSFSTRPVYEFEGGRYQEATDWGSSHLMLAFGLGLGFDLRELTDVPLTVYSRYQFFLQIPGFLGSSALPNAMLQLAARYEMRSLL